MTEIPEHLLKRAKEQRAKLTGQGGGDDGGAATASDDASTAPVPAAASAPATPAAVAPAEIEEAPPAPPPPYVQAALTRKRIPYWVMPVLAFLPVWAYLYQGTLEPAAEAGDPLVIGQQLYEAQCATCHGAGGGGGVGPALSDGAIYETFPDWRDQFRWVRLGSAGWPDDTYGANNKPVMGGMPAFEALSDAEMLLILNYERSALSGEPPADSLDEGLILESELAAADEAASYAVILEEVQALLGGTEITEEDLVIEGEGAPEAG